MTSPALRARYLSDSVSTASPGQLLIMLYDRLVLDLARGETAQRGGDREAASAQLLHAQEIIVELQASLNLEVWPDGKGLAQLYTFLITELITANVQCDAEKTATCRALVEPLRDAWREAAAMTVGAQPTLRTG